MKIYFLTPPLTMSNNKLPEYHRASGLPEGPSVFGERSGAEKLADVDRDKVRRTFRYSNSEKQLTEK